MTASVPRLFDSRHRLAIWLIGLVVLSVVGAIGWRVNRLPVVLLSADGKTRPIPTDAATVGEVLTDAGVKLGPLDFVTPGVETAVAAQLPVQVTRVRRETQTVRLEIPASGGWKIITAQNLRRVRIHKGFVQVRVQTAQITLHDGKEVRRRVSVKTLKRKPAYTLSLLDPAGNVERVYNLREAPHYRMLATAYYVGDPMVPGDTTYLGHKLRRGLVAVDPDVIPLRSRLYIPGYGYAYASDTGSAIKGLRIDLAVQNRQEELRYNHRTVTVYVLEEDRTW